MSLAKTIAKNSLMVTLSAVVTKILSLVLTIIIARYLGDIGFGQYSFVFALTAIFAVFIAFGMDILVIREVAKDKPKNIAFLINSAFLKSILSLVSWVVLAFLIIILKKEPEVNLGIVIIGFCLLPDSLVTSFKAIFSAYEKMEFNTLIEIFFRTVVVILSLLAIFLRLNLIAIFSASLFANILSLFLITYVYSNKIGKIKIEIDYNLCRHIFKTSYAFALISFFVVVYLRIDTVMLSIIKGNAAVGRYSAANTLCDSLLFISTAICSAVFPVLSRLYKESKESFENVYEMTFKFLLLLALPIAAGITILADKIILLVYRSGFSGSILALRILIWSTALIFLNSLLGFVLYSTNKQKIALVTTGIVVLLNIILNYLFIPKFSYIASSYIAVITQLLVFICYFSSISNSIHRVNFIHLFLRPLLSVIVMSFFIYHLRNLNLFILILSAALIYSAMLVILKTFSAKDKKVLKELTSFSKGGAV